MSDNDTSITRCSMCGKIIDPPSAAVHFPPDATFCPECLNREVSRMT